MSRAVDYVCCTVWNLFVFGGAGYLIVKHGWSAWWFIGSFALIARPSKEATS